MAPAEAGGGAEAPAVFALRHVGLRRSGHSLLTDVDWTVRPGERWVVLGPNGAGKTTLLRILATYLVPSLGTVEVLGSRIGRTDVRELRPRMGYLSPALAGMAPGELTARQLVEAAQGGAVLPWYIDRAAVSAPATERALAVVGLAGLEERSIGTMSSGEQLRVQLARALVVEPEALLLDEPMSSLDIGGREQLVLTLATVAAGPVGAIITVVHRLEDIAPGFTHALLLREGRVVAAGPIDEVIADGPLSSAYGLPLQVRRMGERLTVSAGR